MGCGVCVSVCQNHVITLVNIPDYEIWCKR
jgi:Pyruvate/2-oxoacid:ferredoxin oxidoreductase delta subunit